MAKKRPDDLGHNAASSDGGWAQRIFGPQLGGWMRKAAVDTGQRGRRMLSQLGAVRSGANQLNNSAAGNNSTSPPTTMASQSAAAGRRMTSSSLLPKVPKRVERQIRRLGPLLLVVSLVVYLLLGAAAFLFFEHTNHEQTVRKWFFNLIVNRHKFARQISSAIFNGTRNMLVIVDYDSSERIQRDLVQLLSQYEQQLEMRVPDLNEWTLTNSLTYCWGLLTTIGHGHRAPKTSGGQVFALFYCLLGVPFFLLTLIVLAHRLFQLCRAAFHRISASSKRPLNHPLLANHRALLLLLLSFIYCLWLLCFAIILFQFAIPESFWRSLYTAVLASLTIQSADYNALGEAQKLLTLAGASISLLLSCLCLFSLTGVWRHGRRVGDENGRQTAAQQQATRFQACVIVDQIGSVKLAGGGAHSPSSFSAPNSPVQSVNGGSGNNGTGVVVTVARNNNQR